MPTLAFTPNMLVAGVVLALTFLAIFTEQLHGVERSKVACAGAVAMILAGQVFGFYSPTDALTAVEWCCATTGPAPSTGSTSSYCSC